MATTSHSVEEKDTPDFDIDIPANREYETDEDEALDESLVEAIKAARNADNEFLAKLLTRELGSHYYETR